jgi:hypothetical protein
MNLSFSKDVSVDGGSEGCSDGSVEEDSEGYTDGSADGDNEDTTVGSCNSRWISGTKDIFKY